MRKSLCVDCPHCGKSYYGASCRKAMQNHIAKKHIDALFDFDTFERGHLVPKKMSKKKEKIRASNVVTSHVKDMKKPKNIKKKKKKRNRSESPMPRDTYSISWKLRRVIEYQKAILCKQGS